MTRQGAGAVAGEATNGRIETPYLQLVLTRLWEEERAATIEKIKDGGYGISADGKSALISDGYTVDLTKCTAGWSNTQGIENGTLKISQAIALSLEKQDTK